jgi:hypothetical protein
MKGEACCKDVPVTSTKRQALAAQEPAYKKVPDLQSLFFVFTRATAADEASFTPGITRFIGREAVAAPAGVRGLAALAGNTALGFRAHGCKAAPALGAYAVGRAHGSFGRFGGRLIARGGFGSFHSRWLNRVSGKDKKFLEQFGNRRLVKHLLDNIFQPTKIGVENTMKYAGASAYFMVALM